MQKKILDEIMPLRIIREVEKWPAIYQKDNRKSPNSLSKNKVWEQVAKNLLDNYQIYSAAEQQDIVSNLKKRWRNLRDTFKRQVMVKKKNREGHNIKKKEYVYFKHMAFLLPHVRDTAPEEPPERRTRRRRRTHIATPTPAATSSVPDLEHIDEDRHFLLSLLPSFKRMNHDEKLTAKMEILKVIKDVKNSSAALDTLVVEDTLAGGPHDTICIKEEQVTIEVMDYKSPTDSEDDDTD